MEFEFDVHKIFLEPITKLDHSLIPLRRPLISSSEAQKQIMKVIDEIGKSSAKAQRLPAPITSASRMQTNQHHLYILKDCSAQTAGRGVVIGFLKVGYKKLFVLNHAGSHIEAEPLCILDFYIHESLQRHGFGKELFKFMLRTEKVEPQHLAIDRPSEKFLSFLRKHYNLCSTIPQVNNFVVFEGFFRDRKADVTSHREVEDRPANRHAWKEARLGRCILANCAWRTMQALVENMGICARPPGRKLPPKRAEGEIKPYSLSERDFLKQEEGLPWPFSQAQSSLSRAGSLGSSPTRTCSRPTAGGEEFMKSLRVCRPHSLHRAANGEQEDPSQRRRTSDTNLSRGLLAQRNCYSRHMSPPLLSRAPPTVDVKEEQNESDKGVNKESVHMNGDLGMKTSPYSNKNPHQPPRMPSQPQTSGGFKCPPSDEGQNKSCTSNLTKSPSIEPPSWTVLGAAMNAQWVKRKQELRGTRPW